MTGGLIAFQPNQQYNYGIRPAHSFAVDTELKLSQNKLIKCKRATMIAEVSPDPQSRDGHRDLTL